MSLSLELIWSYVFPGSPIQQQPQTSLYGKVTLCPDAIITMLTLTRCHVHASRSADIPNTITQFLCFLYSNTPEFQPIFTSADILTALSLTIIPIDSGSHQLPSNPATTTNNDDVFEDEGEGTRTPEFSSCATSAVPTPTQHPQTTKPIGDFPAKKIILDFLRIIIIDWMNSQGANQKPNQNVVVDTVLDAGSQPMYHFFYTLLARQR